MYNTADLKFEVLGIHDRLVPQFKKVKITNQLGKKWDLLLAIEPQDTAEVAFRRKLEAMELEASTEVESANYDDSEAFEAACEWQQEAHHFMEKWYFFDLSDC